MLRNARMMQASIGLASVVLPYTPAIAQLNDTPSFATVMGQKDLGEARQIAIPGSTNVIAIWTDSDPAGPVNRYAVSLDGKALAGRVREIDYTISLRYASFDPLAGEPAVSEALRSGPSNDLYIVQFYTAPLESYTANLVALGANVHDPLGNGARIVRMTPVAAAQVAGLPFVRWVGALHPAYRMDEVAQQAALGSAPEAAQRWSITVFERGPAQQEFVRGYIESRGGLVHFTQDGLSRMEATMTPALLREVAGLGEVKFVDCDAGPMGMDMDIARQVLGSNYVQTSPLNFDGTGVRGEIFDTEICLTHQEWKNPPILHSTGSSGGALHGSAAFGICFAQGVSPEHKGHMPNGQGIFFLFSESTGMGGPKSRLEIAQESVDPNGPYRSLFQTASVGSAQTSAYTTRSAEMDDVTFQTNYLHCQAMSNTASTLSRPEAWAKNMVSVGGVNHNNSPDPNTYSSSGSSTGPAQDGRLKPDLVGFFDNIQTTWDCGYTPAPGISGTSPATPMVCGAIGIFYQMWHEQVWAGFGGGSSVFDSRANLTTAKAAMINTAHRFPLTQNGLTRVRQGWGLPDLTKLYDARLETFIVDATDPVVNNGTIDYYLEVAPGAPELLITMAYLDPAGPIISTQNRVNDLSLFVTSPSGAHYWGNNGLMTGNVSTPGGTSNTKDTVENVFLQNPQAGMWYVRVHGDEVVFDTVPETPAVDAHFSLWVTGAVGTASCYADCDTSGTLDFFDFLCFQSSFTAGLCYADCDNSGTFDFFDFLCFQNMFAGGCP